MPSHADIRRLTGVEGEIEGLLRVDATEQSAEAMVRQNERPQELGPRRSVGPELSGLLLGFSLQTEVAASNSKDGRKLGDHGHRYAGVQHRQNPH